MDLSSTLSLLKEWGPVFGPALLVLAFFLWKDWRRETRLQDRVDALEKEQKETLLPLIEKCATVIAQNTAVMSRLEKVLEQKSQALALLEKVLDRQTLLEHCKERCVLEQLMDEPVEEGDAA
jgi:hypothetical protein